MLTIQEFQQTLQYHDNLNSKLFKNNKLRKNIKNYLLNIAELFRVECKIQEDGVIDIILTGGNANYNYTTISDIDIHIIIDFSTINNGDIDLVDYYKDKKNLWAVEHNITILGYPVELYIQNSIDGHPSGQGIYSILHNRWVVVPKQISPNYEDPTLINKVEKFIEKIDQCQDIDTAKRLKETLKNMRTSGLLHGGEFSIENLVFKQLRNIGVIDKLDKVHKTLVDRAYTI